MARFNGDFKQGHLIALYRRAKAAAVPLLEAIEAHITEKFVFVDGGYNITSTSGAGHSTSFFVPIGNSPGLTPQTLMEFGAELRRVYTECNASLTAPDDAAIFEEMLLRFQPVRRMRDDFSLMRRFA